MHFSSTDNEVREAINVLDRLVNSESSNTMDIIRKYKNNQEIDPFTSFRLKKELTRINGKI